jgi:hypothetical protein
LQLPQTTAELQEVVGGQRVDVARVVNDRIGDLAPARLVAAGPEAARLHTDLILAPLDDVVMVLTGVALYGQISECEVTDDGQCRLTMVFTGTSEHARHIIDDLTNRALRQAN